MRPAFQFCRHGVARGLMIAAMVCFVQEAPVRAQMPQAPPAAPRPQEVAATPSRPARPNPSDTRPIVYGDSPQRIRALAQRAALNPAPPVNQLNHPPDEADDADDSATADPPARTPFFGAAGAESTIPGRSNAGSPSPASPEASQPSNWMLDTLTALGIVIAVILLTRWAIARVGGRMTAGAGRSPVEVLSRTAIAPRNHVVLLKIGQRIIVVGDSPAGLRALTEIVDPEEVAMILADTSVNDATSIRRGFGQLMNRLNRDYDAADRVAQEGADESEHLIDRARNQLSSLMSRVRAARIREEA